MREDLITTREEHVNRFIDAKMKLYPTWNGRTHSVAGVLENNEKLIADKTVVTVAGRLRAKRNMVVQRSQTLLTAAENCRFG
jgi:hypothetical protein